MRKLLLSLLFAASTALAEGPPRTFNLNLVYVENDLALLPTNRHRVEKEMLRLWRGVPQIKFKISRSSVKDTAECARQRVALDYQSFGCYRRFQSKKANTLVGIIAPPLTPPNGQIGIGGVSTSTCTGFGGMFVVYASPFNAAGLERILQVAAALAHELGHILGAEHLDQFNSLMHTAALQFVPAAKFLRESRIDVTDCVFEFNSFKKQLPSKAEVEIFE